MRLTDKKPLFEIYDSKTNTAYKATDKPVDLGKELNFSEKAERLLIDSWGNIYLAFASNQMICLTCAHKGRFTIIPGSNE